MKSKIFAACLFAAVVAVGFYGLKVHRKYVAGTTKSSEVPAAMESGHWIRSPVLDAARVGKYPEAMLDEARVPRPMTPLLSAVSAGDVEKVRQLLESGSNPDDPTAAMSPLVLATMSRGGYKSGCKLPIVQLLLKHGANPNRPDTVLGTLPLLQAFGIGDMKCAEIIRAAGAPADTRGAGGENILHNAVRAAATSGDMSPIDVALSWGIAKDIQLQDGSTALHEAVRHGSDKTVKALLDRGVNPCIKNLIGQTPLDEAVNLSSDRPGPHGLEIISIFRAATKCT